MLFFIRFFYAPFYFIGFIGFAMWLIHSGFSPLYLAPLLISAIAISLLAEKALPYEPLWNISKGDQKRDIIHALVNEFSVMLSVAMIPLLTASVYNLTLWPHSWPLYLQLALAIIIADFGITLTHYLSHKINFLWRFHKIHHGVERMYGFNGLLKHPLHQALEVSAGTFPLLLLGVPIDLAMLLGFAAAIQLTLQHSNVDMKIGPLIYVWAIAPAHRYHHIASSKGDVNFGLFTPFWDYLLGTFTHQGQTPRDGEIGVEDQADFPTNYRAQLIAPFRK